uniref:Uncharacterized protein n=1 Tax=Oryza brachyantha TaxID=4533 RepID=J3NCA2_ORYBR
MSQLVRGRHKTEVKSERHGELRLAVANLQCKDRHCIWPLCSANWLFLYPSYFLSFPFPNRFNASETQPIQNRTHLVRSNKTLFVGCFAKKQGTTQEQMKPKRTNKNARFTTDSELQSHMNTRSNQTESYFNLDRSQSNGGGTGEAAGGEQA